MKVFLSSTYVDLIEHRDVVIKALRTMGQDVDHMEIFGALDKEPTKAALEQLEQCDLVVGIYAYRYGSIPKRSKISITEQEYFHTKSKNLPILCFVADDNFGFPRKLMDKDTTKIDDFKSKVMENNVVDFFTTPDNLASKVASAVGKYYAENISTPETQTPFYESQKPTGNTLPTRSYFVGREKELAIIASAISPEARTWGALIDGPGGIGKTALAIESAHDAPDELFERKIFITAKVRELTPEGEKKLTDFTRPTYIAMLDELGRELGEEGLEKLPPDDRPNEIRLALAGDKTLIVFDNLETLPEEERTRLFQFLSRLPEGNKAIATSRRSRRDIDARAIRLDRMEKDEALQLIEKIAESNPRLAREKKEEYQKLYEITNGNPLLIKWVCGQLGREGSAMHTITEAYEFINNAPKSNDPLEYIFGDLLKSFTENETKVLAALTHFTQPAKIKWIADMTNLTEHSAKTALEDLTDRSVLISNIELQTFYLPPLAAQFIKTRRPEAVTQTGDALTDRAYALAMEYGGGSEDYEKFHLLDTEWDLISAALPRLFEERSMRLLNFLSSISTFLTFKGRWDEKILLSEHAEKIFQAEENARAASIMAFSQGWVYARRNQLTEASTCADRSEKYILDLDEVERVHVFRLRGIIYRLSGNYSESIEVLTKALNLAGPNSHLPNVSALLNELGRSEHKNQEFEKAKDHYQKALENGKKTNNKELIAHTTGFLGQLALDQQHWKEAETLLTEALQLEENIGHQGAIATQCARLAKSLIHQNRAKEALPLAQRAVNVLAHQRTNYYYEAQKILAECEAVLKNDR